ANPNLKGDEAVRAVEQNTWDPSVKSLVAFPQILQMMDEKLGWTERLGDAFLAQQALVMDTVQNLRQKAYEAGNLKSSDQVNVTNCDFRTVKVSRVTVWQHDPVHRRCVLYRDASSLQQFIRMRASPELRRDFRGHEPSSFEGRREFGTRPEARGGHGSRLEERGSPGGLGARPNMGSPPGRSNVPDVSRPDVRSAPSRPSVPSGVSPPH